MNKNICAFIALLAVVQAVPYGRGSLNAVPYAPAPSVVYQQIPVVVEAAAPKYAAPIAPAPISYAAPIAPAPISYAAPIAPAPISYAAPIAPAPARVSYAVPSAPLIAGPNQPQAKAAASAIPGLLRPGSYSQLAIPSYNIVSPEPAPEANIGLNYGLPSLRGIALTQAAY